MSVNVIAKKESGVSEEALNALPLFSDETTSLKDIRAIYVVGSEGSPNTQAIYSSYTQGLLYEIVNNGNAVEVRGYTSNLQTAILEGKVTSIIIPKYIYSYHKAETTGKGWLPVVGVNIYSENDLNDEAKAKIISIIVGDNVEYLKYTGNSNRGAFATFKGLVTITSPFTGDKKQPGSTAHSSGEWFGDWDPNGKDFYNITPPKYWNLESGSPSSHTTRYSVPSSLKVIKITAEIIQPLAFMYFMHIQHAYIDQALSIGAWAFRRCDQLETISLNEGLTTIGERAFQECKALRTISLPKDLTSLGKYAFTSCTKLSEISIPKGLTILQQGSFANCSSLENISFEQGSKLATIGASAFFSCSNLIDIEIPNKVTSIGNQAFWYSGLQSAIINNNVKSIEEYAFRNCESLTTVKIESPITFIGDYAFADNPELFILELTGKGQATLGRGVFQNCKKLEEVVIPVGFAKKFSEEIFAGCSKIQKMQIPFVGLEQGTSTQYCFGALFSTDQPSDSNNYYQATQVIIKNSNTTTTTDVTYYIPKSLINVIVCQGSIPAAGFANCKYVTSIELKEGVTDIGAYALTECSNLTQLNIPSTVTSIGEWALNDCSGLTEIYYGGTLASWEALIRKNQYIFTYPNNTTTVQWVHCTDGKTQPLKGV